MRGLEALGVESEQYGSFLVPVIMAKLPSEVRLQIARSTTNAVWKVEELLRIIQGEVEAREMSDFMRTSERRPETPFHRNNTTTSALTERDNINGGRICVYCKGGHYSASCDKVSSIQSRKDILKKEGRCFLCLANGHRVSQCSSNKKCRKCQRRHHQSICEATGSNTNASNTNAGNTNPSNTNAGNSDVSNTNVSNSDENTTDSTTLTSPVPRTKVKVLLQTARTQAYAVNGEKVPVRVLFDSGSQKSYITNQLKARLGLTPIKKELLNLNVFGSVTTRKQSCDVVKVKLQGKYNEDAEILALGFSTICSPLPRTVELHQYPQLRELELADCTPSKEEEKESLAIDILIGCDFYWEIVSGDISRANGGLVAIKSKFGWLLSGPARYNRGAGVESHCNLIVELPNNVTTVPEEGESKIVDELKKFWETEAIGIVEREDIDQEVFPEQVRYDFIGRRYTVSLPWKIHRPHSNNYGLCVSRLHQLMSRLKRDQALLTEYNKILETQLEEGIIEAIPTTEMNSQEEVYYLPYHGVVRTDKDTTKLRIVLDASARAGPHHYSLNECLEKGPNLTPLIFDVLVKFRGNIIGITADIEKAFHQIIIAEKDRNMLRMLWFNDVHTATPKIVHYRFCHLVFGLTPSPAILRGVIQYHLSKYQTSNPHVARLLADMLYVDDFPGGAENSEKGFKLYQEAKEIMKAGGFNLRKWRTNSSTLQKLINQAEANTNEVEGKPVKILGLCWDTQEDTFWFDPEEITNYAKRLPTT